MITKFKIFLWGLYLSEIKYTLQHDKEYICLMSRFVRMKVYKLNQRRATMSAPNITKP